MFFHLHFEWAEIMWWKFSENQLSINVGYIYERFVGVIVSACEASFDSAYLKFGAKIVNHYISNSLAEMCKLDQKGYMMKESWGYTYEQYIYNMLRKLYCKNW